MAYNNSNNGGNRFPQRPRNISDERYMTLWGERGDNGKSPMMGFSLFNNFPRIRFNKPTDGSNDNVEFKLDMRELYEVLSAIEEVARGTEKKRVTWNLEGWTPKGGGGKGVTGTLMVGRTDAGEIYIGGTKFGWDKPVMIKFRSNLRFKRVDASGNEVPAGEVSATIAIAWVNIIRDICSQQYFRDWEWKEPNQSKGNNNGGNQNRNNNSGGGAPAETNFDDIDFF